ncbi:MAG: hypothetical protein AAF668_16865 [Pseudomonadota bacterium]
MTKVDTVYTAEADVELLTKIIGKRVFFFADGATVYPDALALHKLFVFPADASPWQLELEWKLDYIEDPFTPFGNLCVCESLKPEGQESISILAKDATDAEIEYSGAYSAAKPGATAIDLRQFNEVVSLHFLQKHSISDERLKEKSPELDGIDSDGCLVFELRGEISLAYHSHHASSGADDMTVELVRTRTLPNYFSQRRVRLSVGPGQDLRKISPVVPVS